MDTKELQDLCAYFDRMADNWPSEFVARKKVETFTGGMLTGKTMANFDADKKRESPPRVTIGRCVAYPKKEFVEWMKCRALLNRRWRIINPKLANS